MRLVRYDTLVAPEDHQGVLVEPSAPRIRAALAAFDAGQTLTAPLLGAPIAELRRNLRARLRLDRGPLIITGHQAEFYHAGVFAKNIAADWLARGLSGCAAFLMVDADTPKTTTVRYPAGSGDALRIAHAPIPGCDPHLGFEFQPPQAQSSWRSFFDLLSNAEPNAEARPLAEFARTFVASAHEYDKVSYCDGIELAFADLEVRLGLGPIRYLRTSYLTAESEFGTFAAAMLLAPEACATAYNAAQQEFRVAHRVRTAARPVPPLIQVEDRWELPLWIVRTGGPRQRLFVTSRNDRVALFADHVEIAEIPHAALRRAVDGGAFTELHAADWHFRPRALTLSAIARLLLADLFIHGIGGAKYDEVTENWIRRWLGVELAPLCCVTATLRLPLARNGDARRRLAQDRKRLRDAAYNPQRYFPDLPTALLERRAALIAASDELRRRGSRDRTARHRIYREIRALNSELVRAGASAFAGLESEVSHQQKRLLQHQIENDREYFVGLHPREELEQLLRAIRAGLAE